MKKIILFIVTVLCAFLLCACGDTGKTDGKLSIVTTLFPQYDFASTIAGDKAQVTMLLPFGTDIHTYEPSVRDMADVSSCDIFIYNGSKTEPLMANILENVDTNRTKVVDLSENILLLEGDVHDGHTHGEGEHTHDYDPHFWTSPKNAIIMVDEILGALCSVDEKNADYYVKNAQALKLQLSSLSDELSSLAENNGECTLYFGGKFAFLYMFSDYGFDHVSPYKGCSDESEPSIKTITEVCRAIRDSGAKYIFIEEMSESKVAKSVAQETDTELLVLHSCQNISKNEAKAGETYVTLMRKNIANIRRAITERK